MIEISSMEIAFSGISLFTFHLLKQNACSPTPPNLPSGHSSHHLIQGSPGAFDVLMLSTVWAIKMQRCHCLQVIQKHPFLSPGWGRPGSSACPLAARFLYLLCGLGGCVVSWDPFLEPGSGQAVSCPGKQLRSTSGDLSGDGARRAGPALPGWWQCLCLSPFPIPPVEGSSGVELPSMRRDGWQLLCLQHHQCWADALHHSRGSSAHCCSTHRPMQSCQSRYDDVPEAARQMNFLNDIHLYF